MATINEIKQQAAAVKNATQVGENTAERVGGALAGLAEIAEQHSLCTDTSIENALSGTFGNITIDGNILTIGKVGFHCSVLVFAQLLKERKT